MHLGYNFNALVHCEEMNEKMNLFLCLRKIVSISKHRFNNYLCLTEVIYAGWVSEPSVQGNTSRQKNMVHFLTGRNKVIKMLQKKVKPV